MKYIVLTISCIALFSCQGLIADRQHPPVSSEKLDTIKMSADASFVTPSVLESAFSAGSKQLVNNKELLLFGINIGNLKVPSGRIVACDPMHIDEYGIPFTEQFPTGEFPVQLSIAKMGGEEKVAFARIVFRDAPVVSWKLALIPGQQPLAVGADDYHGFSVDAGTAIYIDDSAKKQFDYKAGENMDADLFKAMDQHYRKSWRYIIYNFSKYNLAAFNTGMGDGTFATYIGYDGAGTPVRLTTDFGLLNWKQSSTGK